MPIVYELKRNDFRPNEVLLKIFAVANAEGKLLLQLSAWRPGRYELAHYARNILSFAAYDTNGNILKAHKTNYHSWQVTADPHQMVVVQYTYFAAQPDAGGTWVDEDLLYINPINCFMKVVSSPLTIGCDLVLKNVENCINTLPLKLNHDGVFQFDHWEMLADTPFMISKSLQKVTYQCKGIPFNIWFYGLTTAIPDKVAQDFKKFTTYQLERFEDFPVDQFDFLVLTVPYAFYHGVEHASSTVLCLGPPETIFTTNYTEFLGVASHELYHVWNVKHMRPADFLNYDYTQPNYSHLGWIYEGVTTYMGDLILMQSGVFSEDQWIAEINTILKRHRSNYGFEQQAVADASFDTWVDGYQNYTPNRKSSIYVEGCLNAWLLDLMLQDLSNNKYTLHDFMASMWLNFGHLKKGYTAQDVINTLAALAPYNWENHINKYINGTGDLEAAITTYVEKIGFKLKLVAHNDHWAEKLGVIIEQKSDGKLVVSAVAPKSPLNINVGFTLLRINNTPVDQITDWQNLPKLNEPFTATWQSPLGTYTNTAASTYANNSFYAYFTLEKA